MSDIPCTGCRSTSNGRLTYFYVNYYDDQVLVKKRVRLCRECVVDLAMPMLTDADSAGPNGAWQPVERSYDEWKASANSDGMARASFAAPQSSPQPPTSIASTENGEAMSKLAEVATDSSSRRRSSSSRPSSKSGAT